MTPFTGGFPTAAKITFFLPSASDFFPAPHARTASRPGGLTEEAGPTCHICRKAVSLCRERRIPNARASASKPALALTVQTCARGAPCPRGHPLIHSRRPRLSPLCPPLTGGAATLSPVTRTPWGHQAPTEALPGVGAGWRPLRFPIVGVSRAWATVSLGALVLRRLRSRQDPRHRMVREFPHSFL